MRRMPGRRSLRGARNGQRARVRGAPCEMSAPRAPRARFGPAAIGPVSQHVHALLEPPPELIDLGPEIDPALAARAVDQVSPRHEELGVADP